MRYILWVVALLEACDVTNNRRHLGCNLAFYQELGIRLKLREIVFFFVLCMKNNTSIGFLHDFSHKVYCYC